MNNITSYKQPIYHSAISPQHQSKMSSHISTTISGNVNNNIRCSDAVSLECTIKDGTLSCKPNIYYNDCTAPQSNSNCFNNYKLKKDIINKGLELNTKWNDVFNKCQLEFNNKC